MDWISAEELRTRKIEEHKGKFRIEDYYGLVVWEKKKKYSAWSSKRKTFKVSGSLHRGKPRKHGLKERKVSKDIAKDRNA